MEKATVSLYINEKHLKHNGTCSVKVKITFMRKRKYYPTGIDMSPAEFNKVLFGNRKSNEDKSMFASLMAFQHKAQTVIDKLNVFSFGGFEEKYFEHRNTYDEVMYAFEKYIEQLTAEQRLGTANSYKNAKQSLAKFRKSLTFAEITPKLLKDYESSMLNAGKSLTTVGIYLRSLRTIYNAQGIDRALYPFGDNKVKYTIPIGRNLKKALVSEEIGKIYNYKAKLKSPEDMSRDYWIFLYLCNGMNIKDFCELKWNNIDNNVLSYQRAKTKSTSRDNKKIIVSLKKEALEIIKKWSKPSFNKEEFIFPHFTSNMSPVEQRRVLKQLNKNVNKYMKRIAQKLGIEKEVTTYYARHSFATTLKQYGTATSMISDLLGHSNIKTTENYLDGFGTKQIEEATDVLTKAFAS